MHPRSRPPARGRVMRAGSPTRTRGSSCGTTTSPGRTAARASTGSSISGTRHRAWSFSTIRPAAARRSAPLHPRCLLVGDPRGRRGPGRGPARRDPARAARGDRRERARVAPDRQLRPVELHHRRTRLLWLATGLSDGEAAPDPTEDLAVRWVPFDEALAMTVDGRITDAVSIMGIQRVALARLGAAADPEPPR